MNLHEALSVLELNQNASDEDVNKAFRKFAAKNHPDANKESGAEEKFKKINEAYQFLKENGTNPQAQAQTQQHPFNNPINFDDFMSVFNVPNTQNGAFNFFFGRQPQQKLIHRMIVQIPFVESVKTSGSSKSIEFDRKIKCERCNGTKKFGVLDCTSCSGTGTIQKKHKIQFMYRREHSAITLGGEGDFYQVQNMYCDLQIVFEIIADPYFKQDPRNPNNIISDIRASLLDCIKGNSIIVQTIDGEKSLKIPPKTKNGDVIRINGYGTSKAGAHLFNIEVFYPDETDALIKFLENKSPEKENQDKKE
jgi:DnaJ-class molecular chaperone